VPDPRSDADQHRFAQIVGRMLDGVAENIPDFYMKSSGAKDRSEYREKLGQSDAIRTIIECCAFVAQTIEEERARGKRP
jgi:hypothetical protein